MSQKKLIASAAAVLTAITMSFPCVMSVSAVQIATESNTVTEEPAQTEDPSTDTAATTEPTESQTTKQTKTTTETQETEKTKNTTKTTKDTKQTTEDTEATTKKKKKKTTTTTTTTAETTTTEPTTTTETTTTTEEEDKTSYHSANVELSHSGFDEDNEVKVKLKIDSDAMITKAKIYLDFDESILEYKNSSINDEEIGGISSDSLASGRYTFEFSNSSGTEFDGTYVTVNFSLKKSTTADQTAVITVIESLEDEDGKDISANASTSNAIMTLPDKEDDSGKDDDDSKESMPDGSDRNYQPINLSLSDKEISLGSLGINEYKSIETDNESVASIEDGKIVLHQAGECKMTITYKDDTKGYYVINVKEDEAVSSEDVESSSGSAAGSLEKDNNSKNKTLKITVVILIVCVALVLLIVEYFVLVVRRRKKAQQNRHSSKHRHTEDYVSDYDDDEEYVSRDFQTRRLNVPAEHINEGDEDSDVNYQYPTTNNTKVNDFEDFLSNDPDDDIKFTGNVNKQHENVRPDIEDFTLSQNGVNKG